MTTIIIHGTMAAKEKWYWDSWNSGGFCNSLSGSMIESSGYEDVWKVNGISVNDIPEFNPKWNIWTGRIGKIVTNKGHFFGQVITQERLEKYQAIILLNI